jgi:hypothetical protein
MKTSTQHAGSSEVRHAGHSAAVHNGPQAVIDPGCTAGDGQERQASAFGDAGMQQGALLHGSHGSIAGGGAAGPGDSPGVGGGSCIADGLQPDTTVYSDEAIAGLLYMIEEEKFAGDLYDVFFEQTGILAFSNIAAAEDRHMAMLLDQAAAMGIDTGEILALPPGDYVDPALDLLFATLREQGSASTEEALAAGQLVEATDIADIGTAIDAIGLVGTPLEAAYNQLLEGSTHHLAAFDLLIG